MSHVSLKAVVTWALVVVVVVALGGWMLENQRTFSSRTDHNVCKLRQSC